MTASAARVSLAAANSYLKGGYSSYGHVAIVVATTTSSYTVSEANYVGLGVVDLRTIRWPDPATEGFIK